MSIAIVVVRRERSPSASRCLYNQYLKQSILALHVISYSHIASMHKCPRNSRLVNIHSIISVGIGVASMCVYIGLPYEIRMLSYMM
jgi:hypothetical protein